MNQFSKFRLKVQRFDRPCVFELSWGSGQQLEARLNYPESLAGLYQEWQRVYLSFYKTALRGRIKAAGTINSPPIRIQFKVIAAKERQAIARELTQLEATLKPQGATAEMIALYKANYFASRQLGFDALQFALNVQNPSPELTQVIQTIPQRACPFPRYQQPPTG